MPDGREDDDIALLEAWCRGDRSAGNRLFERHYQSVARFFHNKVSEAAQEDLIHDTFVACQKSVARFRRQSSFRVFLFGIARNVLAEHLRRMARQKARLEPELDLDEVSAASLGLSQAAIAMRHEEQRLLLEALRNIPLPHQIALELHYWEELTAAEIAEVLAIPLGTAKTRLYDGREHLKEQLRRLARSVEALQSTLDDLDQWARRMRTQVGSAPAAGGRERRAGGAR